jgi:hypothetical protein
VDDEFVLFLRKGKLAMARVPKSKMRRFVLDRKEDVHDTSGTGEVVEGIQFSSGKVVLTWRTKTASIVVFDNAKDMLNVHGHGGKTVIKWID